MFRSQEGLGEAVGFSQNAIHHALKIGRVSPAMALAIHAATEGRVSKHDLAPEIFGPRKPRKKPHQQAAE